MGLFGSGPGAAQAGEAAGAPMSWQDRLAIIGAGLKDASPGSGGGNLMAIQQMMGARVQDAQKKALQARLLGLFGGQAQEALPQQPAMQGPGVDGEPVSHGVMPTPQPRPAGGIGLDDPRLPALMVQAKLAGIDLGPALEAMKAAQPLYHLGPNGEAYNEKSPAMAGRRFANPTVVNGQILDVNDPASMGRVVPRQPAEVPYGWRLSADGKSLEPVPGGPADPAYQARLTGLRRDQIVARPMPQRAKAGGSTGLPPGYVPR